MNTLRKLLLLSLGALALFGLVACGSDVSKESTEQPTEQPADAGTESACDVKLIEADGGCVAPASIVFMGVTMTLDANVVSGSAYACVDNVVDDVLYEAYAAQNPTVVFSTERCEVFDTSRLTNSEDRGEERLDLTGGFSVTRDGESVSLSGTDLSSCLEPSVAPDQFFEYGATYRLDSAGTVAPRNQADVAIPNAPGFELSQLKPGEDYVLNFQTSSAESVRIEIGDFDDSYIVACKGPDDGSITVPASVTEYFVPGSKRFLFNASNSRREVIDDVIIRRFGASRVEADLDVVE